MGSCGVIVTWMIHWSSRAVIDWQTDNNYLDTSLTRLTNVSFWKTIWSYEKGYQERDIMSLRRYYTSTPRRYQLRIVRNTDLTFRFCICYVFIFINTLPLRSLNKNTNSCRPNPHWYHKFERSSVYLSVCLDFDYTKFTMEIRNRHTCGKRRGQKLVLL